MKKCYEIPELELIVCTDVIACSNGTFGTGDDYITDDGLPSMFEGL